VIGLSYYILSRKGQCLWERIRIRKYAARKRMNRMPNRPNGSSIMVIGFSPRVSVSGKGQARHGPELP